MDSKSDLKGHSPSVSTSFDQNLRILKRKLIRLSHKKQQKDHELCQWSKKVKTIISVQERMAKDRREGKHATLEQLNQVEELIQQVEEIGNSDVFEKKTAKIATSSNAPPFFTTKLFGRDYEKSKILESLMSDGISRVGVYGMGGVGKTEIVMNIYNELLKDETFDSVFWVTMPQYLSVHSYQNVMGLAVHLDELFDESDEKIRAAMLNRFLTSGKKYAMILDGLWGHFNYYDVGIPLTYDGFKLLITCRSLDVSRMMLCQEIIKISPLEHEQANDWKLFLHELGVQMELSKEVAEIAQKIVEACGGLPLYIKAIATRMRRVENVQEWTNMMEKMNDSKERFHELKDELHQLKMSYIFLSDRHLQQCLIFCAFYCGRGKYVLKEELEGFLIDVGLSGGKNNRGKAQIILEKLENACLLRVEGKQISMHDSLIDMAVHVATVSNPFMVDFVQAAIKWI